jgi:hypothetical protein
MVLSRIRVCPRLTPKADEAVEIDYGAEVGVAAECDGVVEAEYANRMGSGMQPTSMFVIGG